MENRLKEKDEQLRTAMRLLNEYTATEEIKLQEGRIESEAERDLYFESATFLNKYYNKKYPV